MITHLHVKSGDDSLNGMTVIGRTIFAEIGCGGRLVFHKLLKINTSQAIDTLYVYNKFGDDIYINYSLNDQTRWAADASRLTPHASRITHHASRITHHASRITPRGNTNKNPMPPPPPPRGHNNWHVLYHLI